jgi:hypothetical protein
MLPSNASSHLFLQTATWLLFIVISISMSYSYPWQSLLKPSELHHYHRPSATRISPFLGQFLVKMLIKTAQRCSSIVIVLFLLLQSTPYSRGLKSVQTVSQYTFQLSSPSRLNALVPIKQITDNKKSSFEYEFTERYEAGVMLTGTEVKSCRKGMVQLSDSVAEIRDGECWLLNCHIGICNIFSVFYQLVTANKYQISVFNQNAFWCTYQRQLSETESSYLKWLVLLLYLQLSMIVAADWISTSPSASGNSYWTRRR